MVGPIVSDDGRWVWSGVEWIPNQEKTAPSSPSKPLPPMPPPPAPVSSVQRRIVPPVQNINPNLATTKIYSQSRFWAICTFHWWTKLLFPKRLILNQNGIQTFDRLGVLMFWLSEEESLNKNMISSVRVNKGLFWDLVIVDTTGGTNSLDLHGMNKSQANALKADIQSLINSRFQ